MKMKNNIIWIIISIVTCFMLGLTIWLSHINHNQKQTIEELKELTLKDTIQVIKHDTIHIKGLREYKEVMVQGKTIHDTIKIATGVNKTDTIISPIELPVSQKEYVGEHVTADGTIVAYKAFISGYKPSLDSLVLSTSTKQTTIIQRVPVIKYKQKHFFIGPNVTAGYSIFNKKPDIMVGLGIGYRF